MGLRSIFWLAHVLGDAVRREFLVEQCAPIEHRMAAPSEPEGDERDNHADDEGGHSGTDSRASLIARSTSR